MSRYVPFLLLVLLFAGCASQPDEARELAEHEKRAVVTYYDRNHDDRVDFELHRFPGMADADWAYCDTKFRGHYDLKIKWRYAIVTERVDVPVPSHVMITPGKPPVYALSEILQRRSNQTLQPTADR